jgi:hypothetical protein
MIDVHVLHLDDEVLRLNDFSLPYVNVYHMPGIVGNVLQARINAFRVGTAPYVSYMDPDDKVVPEAFGECLNTLEANPKLAGVYTNSEVIKENGRSTLLYQKHNWSKEWHLSRSVPVHPLLVMRRSILMPILNQIEKITWTHKFRSLSDQIICAHVASVSDFQYINTVGYIWYKFESGNHKKTTGEDNLQLSALKRKLLA